ncbi:hypothetical protein DL95DRAFT_468216 [Leptodontidium sp. 2 PMI_412]|nr:hypothetical protein DL95DRAFT_468216 [Leptodontidium sp. 2 PMI_412]
MWGTARAPQLVFLGAFRQIVTSTSTLTSNLGPLLAYSHVGLHSTDMSTISALPLFPVLLVLVVAFIARVIWSQYQYNKKYKFPNVVPGWPVLGSTLDVPLRAGMWGVDNAKKYGEM